MKRWIILAAALSAALMQTTVGAQNWPTQPVRIVVPFSPGTSSSVIARMVADELQATYKETFFVENKAGASAIIGADFVAKSRPDGYNLLFATNTAHSVNPHTFAKIPYDPVADFTPIARFSFLPFVLVVSPESPFKTAAELIAYGKANPGKVTWGYANSTGQIASGSFSTLTGLGAVAVGYKTTEQAMVDVMGGRITFLFVDIGSCAGLLQSGKLRPLAISSGERSAILPDVPTVAVAATLPGFAVTSWSGFVGPVGMPSDIVDKISAVIVKMLGRKDVVEKLAQLSIEPAPMGPKDFGRYMAEQVSVWGQKVKEAGIEKQ